MRAPCDSKKARNSSVKNEDPSCRRLNSSSRRPLGLRNRVRISVDKKFPIVRRPFEPFSVLGTCESVKTNAMSGHEIEFSSEIGQWRLRFDTSDHAADFEELGCSAKERLLILVKPESFVTK